MLAFLPRARSIHNPDVAVPLPFGVAFAAVQLLHCPIGAVTSVVSTTRDTSEPAWHRRARRQRADARVLLRLRAAEERLQRHHSAQMTPFARKNFWVCKAAIDANVGTWPRKLCNGTNYFTNNACRFCEAPRPPWANKAAEQKASPSSPQTEPAKGKGGGWRAGRGASAWA